MPLVDRIVVPLPLEYMSQVTPAVAAYDLCPGHAERAVGVSCDGAGNVVVVRGPAAAGLELMVGFVERRVAGSAGVDALVGHVLVVLAGEGGFGALFTNDAELV